MAAPIPDSARADALRRLELARDVTRGDLAARSLQETAASLVGDLCRGFGLRAGALLAIEPVSGTVTALVTAQRGEPQPSATMLASEAVSIRRAALDALQIGRLLVGPDFAEATSLPAETLARLGLDGQTQLILPLLSEGVLIGAFMAAHERPDAFDEQDVAVLRQAGDLLTSAVQEHRLRQQVTDHAAELERKVTEFEAVLEVLPVGICIAYDVECNYVRQNWAATTLFGWPDVKAASAPRLPDGTVLLSQAYRAGRRLPADEFPLHMAARGIACRDLEIEFRRSDGVHRHALVSAMPLLGADGEPRGAVNAMSDITELRHAQDAAVQAQKLESVGLLAGGVAHDFNNLLAAVRMQVEIAGARLESGHPAARNLDKAIATIDKAVALTQQLMAYAGRGETARAPLDLTQLVSSNESLFETALPRSARLHFDLAERLPLVEADPVQMQQVVMNMIINAGEALDGEPGDVRVRTGWQYVHGSDLRSPFLPLAMPAPGAHVFVEVSDTGVGMDENTMARMFDPFFTTKANGRGLGLSAILGIIRGHKGGLQVSSQPGQGSVFRVFLPCSPAGTATASPAGGK